MQIFIKTLTGKSITLDVAPEETIMNVKQKILQKEGLPVNEQRLVFGGKQLADDTSVQDSGLQENSTAHIIMKLKGGI